MSKREARREARRARRNPTACACAGCARGWPHYRGGKPGRQWAQQREALRRALYWNNPWKLREQWP